MTDIVFVIYLVIITLLAIWHTVLKTEDVHPTDKETIGYTVVFTVAVIAKVAFALLLGLVVLQGVSLWK